MTQFIKDIQHFLNIKFGKPQNIIFDENGNADTAFMDKFSQCFVATMNINTNNINSFMTDLLNHTQNDEDYQNDSLMFVKSALSISNNKPLNYSSNKNDVNTQQALKSYLDKFDSNNLNNFDILHVFKLLFTRYGMSHHKATIDSGMLEVLDYFNSQVDYVNNDDNYSGHLAHLTQADLSNMPLLISYSIIFYQSNHQLKITGHFSSANDLLEYDDTDDSTLVSAVLYARGFSDQIFSINNGATEYYMNFQRIAGLPQTGILDRQTLFKIFDPSFVPNTINANKFRATVYDTILDLFDTTSFEFSHDMPDPVGVSSGFASISSLSFYYDFSINPNLSSLKVENQYDDSDTTYATGKIKISNMKVSGISVSQTLNNNIKESISSSGKEINTICNSIKFYEGDIDFKITCDSLSHKIVFTCNIAFNSVDTKKLSVTADVGAKITFSFDSWGPDDSFNTDTITQKVQQTIKQANQSMENIFSSSQFQDILKVLTTSVAIVGIAREAVALLSETPYVLTL